MLSGQKSINAHLASIFIASYFAIKMKYLYSVGAVKVNSKLSNLSISQAPKTRGHMYWISEVMAKSLCTVWPALDFKNNL